jgi:hypothetical protein
LFDALLIATDTFQLVMSIAIVGGLASGVRFSIFRLLRLFRLVRLVRLLRSPVFKDLLTMVQALVGGLITLGWSIVLVFLVLYATSLICRELLGTRNVEHVREYFNTVPRSLFTIFRCSFGDCSSTIGTPIIEHVAKAYGGVWGICYSLFVFFITIGFFNVITAIFLDSTLTAASEVTMRKQRSRLADRKLWASSVATIIRKIIAKQPCGVPENGKLSTAINDILQVEVSRVDFNTLVKKDKHVQRVLHSLDIDPNDHGKIGDILDANHNGSVSILDLVNGIQRLRGSNLKRSDVVSIDLMLRCLQEEVKELSRELLLQRDPRLGLGNARLPLPHADSSLVSPIASDANDHLSNLEI